MGNCNLKTSSQWLRIALPWSPPSNRRRTAMPRTRIRIEITDLRDIWRWQRLIVRARSRELRHLIGNSSSWAPQLLRFAPMEERREPFAQGLATPCLIPWSLFAIPAFTALPVAPAALLALSDAARSAKQVQQPSVEEAELRHPS
jgi:hypothetical protein